MQERTIDNALRALCKAGGVEGRLASVLLELRGKTMPVATQNKPMRRGEASRFVMDALKDGPKTCPQIADILALERPDLTRGAVLQRAYNSLVRLEAKGLVRRDLGPDGCLWRVALETMPKQT